MTAPIGNPAEVPLADVLYGGDKALASDYGPALSDSAARLADRNGWTQADVDAHIVDSAHFFTDAGIQSREASGLHALIAQTATTPADDATVEQWGVESRRALRERYGIDGAAERIKAVAAFVAQRPEVAQLLTETGLGSHPKIVLTLAERVGHLRMTPRARRAE